MSMNQLKEMSENHAKSARSCLGYYKLFWVDKNVKNNENQGYILKFKEFGFIDVREFESIEDCIK